MKEDCEGSMADVNLEDVDELTNLIMDVIRLRLKIDEDSDLDDTLYGRIHNEIRCYFIDPEIIEAQGEIKY